MTIAASIRLTHQSTSIVAAIVVGERTGGDITTSPPLPGFREAKRSGSRLHHLDRRMEVAGVVLRDARDALHELAVDSCTELHGRAVRANVDGIARRDAAAVGVGS